MRPATRTLAMSVLVDKVCLLKDTIDESFFQF
jgi:hypothetical protein